MGSVGTLILQSRMGRDSRRSTLPERSRKGLRQRAFSLNTVFSKTCFLSERLTLTNISRNDLPECGMCQPHARGDKKLELCFKHFYSLFQGMSPVPKWEQQHFQGFGTSDLWHKSKESFLPRETVSHNNQCSFLGAVRTLEDSLSASDRNKIIGEHCGWFHQELVVVRWGMEAPGYCSSLSLSIQGTALCQHK